MGGGIPVWNRHVRLRLFCQAEFAQQLVLEPNVEQAILEVMDNDTVSLFFRSDFNQFGQILFYQNLDRQPGRIL